MIFLQGYGVTSRMAARIYQHYSAGTINKVTSDPFSLADGCLALAIRRDEIARSMGVRPDDPNRIRARIHFALNRMSEGSCRLPRELSPKPELLKITMPERIRQRCK
jgi:exodeoxyribonuclease V alpha subunit